MQLMNIDGNYSMISGLPEIGDKLPAGTYKIIMTKQGFILHTIPNMEIGEQKIYGNATELMDRMLEGYQISNRNMGGILSGKKGAGKTLAIRYLANKAIENDIAVVLVDQNYPGIGSFIESIDQKLLVIFDEFEKIFPESKDDGEGESQEDLLTLFDGTSHSKHLYAVSVNEVESLSSYLLGRTGRFHYHLRFEYPKSDDVRKYLYDNVKKEFASEDQIEKMVAVGKVLNLSYDILRAVVFEMNQGNKVEDFIQYLNIKDENTGEVRVNVEFLTSNNVKTVRSYRYNFLNKN